jgi:hypothetical protein
MSPITKHGMCDTKIYMVWAAMKYRCHKPSHKDYYLYGAKGIRVCERWEKSFAAFYADMGERPSKRHSIDRIDGNKNYEPGNCRWALPIIQNRNRSITKKLTLNGQTLSMMEWAEKTGIKYTTLRERINQLGWSDFRTLTTPLLRKGTP